MYEVGNMNASRNVCMSSTAFEIQRQSGLYGAFILCQHNPRCLVCIPTNPDNTITKAEWSDIKSINLPFSLVKPIVKEIEECINLFI